MEHHILPVISGLLLLTSAPICYSMSLPTGQPQPNTFYYNCYHIFWAQRKTAGGRTEKCVLRYIQHVMFVAGRRGLTDHISAG